MSARRDAVERAAEREEAALMKQYERGEMSPAEYNAAMRDLEREAQAEARAARDQDFEDVRQDWDR